MHRGFLITGALLALVAVILGAFGAHGLKPLLTDSELVTFETGVRYQFYHAFAILVTGILFREGSRTYLRWAGRLFSVGVLIFSGSLYLLTAIRLSGDQTIQWLGPITPVGGLCFVAGWLMMILAIIKKN